MTKPGGTGIFKLNISPRFAPFPPATPTESLLNSENHFTKSGVCNPPSFLNLIKDKN